MVRRRWSTKVLVGSSICGCGSRMVVHSWVAVAASILLTLTQTYSKVLNFSSGGGKSSSKLHSAGSWNSYNVILRAVCGRGGATQDRTWRKTPRCFGEHQLKCIRSVGIGGCRFNPSRLLVWALSSFHPPVQSRLSKSKMVLLLLSRQSCFQAVCIPGSYFQFPPLLYKLPPTWFKVLENVMNSLISVSSLNTAQVLCTWSHPSGGGKKNQRPFFFFLWNDVWEFSCGRKFVCVYSETWCTGLLKNPRTQKRRSGLDWNHEILL